MTPLRMHLLFVDLVAPAGLGRVTHAALALPALAIICVATFGDRLGGGKEKHT